MVQTTLRDRIQSIEDAISAGQVDDAMDDCQQVLKHYPDALELQRLLGEVYLAQGRLEEAQQTFDWILLNDPENVIVYCDRALICEHQSDIDTALDCYQQAYELSRGNSQIRREFNQLSTRAGQQEFMLSRAGLARLYMRGDLLTQAIQEWEAVLAGSPDRLDARLGLLEAYWREGLYDQVERMASRVLEEIPNCLKALLLLAHITSSFNMQRAQDLVHRAEILDPELVIAQELFSNLMASQPNDPFLSLLRKEPITLQDQDTHSNGKPIDTISTYQYAAVEVEAGSPGEESAADRVYNWNVRDNWSELDTTFIQQPDTDEESPADASWSDDTNIQKVDAWTTFDPQPQTQPGDDFETWATEQEIDDDLDPALLEQQPWFQAEQSTEAPPTEEPVAIDSNPGLSHASATWDTVPQEEEVPAPPPWLDMLARSDRRQPIDATPTSLAQALPEEPVQQLEEEQAQEVLQPAQPESALDVPRQWEEPLPASEQEELSSFFFASDDKEEDMGWPEWLKSLGAETMKPEPAPEAQEEPAYMKAWGNQFPLTPPLSHEPEPAQEPVSPSPDIWRAPEEEHITTLETLEQSLLSQGFIPLQPGSLSTIAQEASPAAGQTSEAPEQPIVAAQSPIGEPEPAQSPGYSETAPTLYARIEPATTSATDAVPTATSDIDVSQEAPAAPTMQAEPITPISTPMTPQESASVAAYRADALLDSELETTMKRPAVRLQPIQVPGTQAHQPYPAGKGRTTDRGATDANSKLSSKERLVKGYQYQLAGAYDDAMQEYRILIRNAPELLGEVISNVRALLKLAPKYTAGYRVLGDAYMRQGEYLQAMEAYNKALTMAKKAKSQSH